MVRAPVAAVACLLVVAPRAAAEPPPPAVTAAPGSGLAPLAVTLRAEGDAASYTWELGDGATASGAVVEHVFERPGRYVAAVVAVAADGSSARAEVAVTAYALTLAAPRVATYGTALRLTGTVRPAAGGTRVVLERDGRGVTAVRTNARGEFGATVRANATGAYAVRVGEAVSAPRRVALRPVLETALEGPGVVGRPLRLVARLRPAAAGRLSVVVARDGKRTHAGTYDGAARIGLHSATPSSYRIAVRVVPAEGYARAARTVTGAVIHPQLGPGSRGPSVLALERRLLELRYVVPRADGHYGLETVQAVLAFQKVHGLPRTGRVDARVWRELLRARTPPPRHRGTHIEVSKGRQLLYVVRDSRVEAILHVSTGATGNTPIGTWRIYRKVTGWDWVLWYPMYFLRGFAIHGYPEVPAYPASHGCVRVPMWFAPQLYSRYAHGHLVRIYW